MVEKLMKAIVMICLLSLAVVLVLGIIGQLGELGYLGGTVAILVGVAIWRFASKLTE